MLNVSSLERFDTPIVIVNQVYRGEDWGVVTHYVSPQDVRNAADDDLQLEAGWHISVTRPDLDDVELSEVFGSPEAALEFGISRILSGSLVPPLTDSSGLNGNDHPFGHYHSVVSQLLT